MNEPSDKKTGQVVRTRRAGLAVMGLGASALGSALRATGKLLAWRGFPWVVGGVFAAGSILIGIKYLVLYWDVVTATLGGR